MAALAGPFAQAGSVKAADQDVPAVDPGPRDFEPVSDGHYRLTLPLFGIVFEADRLRWDHNELHGELAVSSEIPGAQPLPRANFNFSSLRARQDLAKLLATRSNARDFDWFGFLDDFGSRLLVAERTGRPSVLLRDVECPDPHSQHIDLHGLALPRRHAGIVQGARDRLRT